MSVHAGSSTFKVPHQSGPINITPNMTYDEDQLTSPLCELSLGTIIEAKEGSTSGESETESCGEPLEAAPPTTATTTFLKKDTALDLSEIQAASPKASTTHPDVDGGWAWVVFIAMFFIFSITSGLLFTTGLYYVQMLIEYEESRSYTAWMGSLMNGFFMLGGPVSSAFIQKYGCRSSLITGSILMTVGYICCAFSTSLEMLFVTYGVGVACGMNFCYSGQIIALAQYFDKKQSIATSVSMMGIGVGMFFLSSLTEYVIVEFGWRCSFILCAGLSLQIAVLGSLVFPLRMVAKDVETLPKQTCNQPGSVLTINKGLPSSRSKVFIEKSLNDRSFSSLHLSMGASYLSHSLLSLHDSKTNEKSQCGSDIRSNQQSFCSKGSHFGIGSIRSNAYSFSLRDSHAGLSQYELHPYHHHRDSFHNDFGIRSNNQSFCSHKESQIGMSGLVSNPTSFSIKASQMDLQHQHPHDAEMEKLFTSEACPGIGKARFMLREGDCDLSCCIEEPELEPTQDYEVYDEQKSKCSRLLEKIKIHTHAVMCSLAKKSKDHPLMDARFWLMDFSVFFCMLGTLILYIIYKDFAEYMGVGEYYSMSLSGIGIGDVVGRVGTGFLASTKYVDAIFAYGLAQMLCCFVMIGHFFICNMASFIGLTAAFGTLYGSQNVLIAVAPSAVFGREKLVIVFGHILFLGGAGALIGAPIAGAIVDYTGMYEGVIWFTIANLFIGSVLMFLCYLVDRSKRQQRGKELDEL